MIKEGKKKKQPGPFNPGLQKMVQYLYEKEIITADKDIADKTKYGKSTVSEYIGGNKEASPEFLKKFEEVFELKIPHYISTKKTGLLAPSAKEYSIDDYINKIEEHNRFLQKVIEAGLVDIKQALTSNFDSLHEGQDSAIVYQKAWIEKIARNEGGSDPSKVQAVKDEMDTIIAEQRRGHQNVNNTDENI